ncbi:MAG: hypothetical protein ACI89L_002133 [Phycisphaerales bacterium]|jgi:hypothetical protein
MLSMNRLSLKAAALITAASLWATPTAVAMQDIPPVINTSSVVRNVSTRSDWDFDGQSDFTQNTAENTSNGTFARNFQSDIAHVQGASADGSASHKSSISSFQIKGEAQCRSDATGPSTDFYIIGASNDAEFEAHFTVPVDTTASFTSRIEADASGTEFFGIGGSQTARVEFTGTRPDGTTFRFYTFRGSGISIGPDEHAEVIDLKANTELVLKWRVAAVATAGLPGDHFATGTLVCELNLGDTDGDGLLDAWETNGIDINSDGIPEIDLPAMGADPFKKNLFLELDSQAGVPVDAAAIAMVEQAFAEAPGSMVDNPDGSDGILLLVLVDDSTLTNQPYVFTDWPAEFDTEKAQFFGPASLRAHPDWDSSIKPFYELIFRYCIWADSLVKAGDQLGGIAELPGDDFIIGANATYNRYVAPYTHLRTKGLAGVFMHEFGHTLNLRHGGQENKNFKPNYLSVMNYTYVYPLRGVTVEGTAREIAWELDFARTAPKVLDENELEEDKGLNGPEGRLILFNAAADTNTPVIQIANADAAEIDWNLSGPPIETNPVAVDISRLGSMNDSLDDALTAFTDWDKIWYPLTGSDDFGDGPHLSAEITEPFHMSIFEALDTFVAVDRSTPSCPADLNGDGIVDLGDIQSFIALFLVQDLAVDFNGDGIIDQGDIQAFITAFLDGC